MNNPQPQPQKTTNQPTNKFIYDEFSGARGYRELKRILRCILPLSMWRTWDAATESQRGLEPPYIGIQKLASKTGRSERTIRNDLQHFEDRRLVKIEYGRKRIGERGEGMPVIINVKFKDFSNLYKFAHEYWQWEQAPLYAIYPPEREAIPNINADELARKKLLKFENYRRLLTQAKPGRKRKHVHDPIWDEEASDENLDISTDVLVWQEQLPERFNGIAAYRIDSTVYSNHIIDSSYDEYTHDFFPEEDAEEEEQTNSDITYSHSIQSLVEDDYKQSDSEEEELHNFLVEECRRHLENPPEQSGKHDEMKALANTVAEAQDKIAEIPSYAISCLDRIGLLLHDRQKYSSRSRAIKLYYLFHHTTGGDSYQFAELVDSVYLHIRGRSFRHGDNGMPLLFHELKNRVELLAEQIKEEKKSLEFFFGHKEIWTNDKTSGIVDSSLYNGVPSVPQEVQAEPLAISIKALRKDAAQKIEAITGCETRACAASYTCSCGNTILWNDAQIGYCCVLCQPAKEWTEYIRGEIREIVETISGRRDTEEITDQPTNRFRRGRRKHYSN